MKYAVVIERGPASYGASVPDLPGCFAVADTLEETKRLIEEAIADHITVLKQQGKPVPPAQTHVTTVEIAS